MEDKRIFGAPDVKKILDCSDSTAKNIMKKMRDMDILIPIKLKGVGKGKYRFKVDSEIF